MLMSMVQVGNPPSADAYLFLGVVIERPFGIENGRKAYAFNSAEAVSGLVH